MTHHALPTPDEFPNPRGDDPWDNDAVHWLLTHTDVREVIDRGNLMECARRQPKRLESDIDRVILAAKLCERHGVEQVHVFDPKIGKTVWRLRRTDPNAPEYPIYLDQSASAPVGMPIQEEDREAAQRLLNLLGPYEDELRGSGKSSNTIITYVDRAERFLRRVTKG